MLRERLAQLRDTAAAAELRRVLDSATIVEPPDDDNSIAFGARVSVRDAAGELQTFQIVGVDEIDLYPDAVSWVSPIGRTLLAAELGDRVTLHKDVRVEIVKVEYPPSP